MCSPTAEVITEQSLRPIMSDCITHSSLVVVRRYGKAPGPDGIAMEALIFGSHRLHVHLCVLSVCQIQLSPISFHAVCHVTAS